MRTKHIIQAGQVNVNTRPSNHSRSLLRSTIRALIMFRKDEGSPWERYFWVLAAFEPLTHRDALAVSITHGCRHSPGKLLHNINIARRIGPAVEKRKWSSTKCALKIPNFP